MKRNKIYNCLLSAKEKLGELKVDEKDLVNLNKKVSALGYIKSAISELEKGVNK